MGFVQEPDAKKERVLTSRKQKIIDSIEKNFDNVKNFTFFNQKFHFQDQAYHQFLIEPDLKVLEIGCGNGDLLSSVRPSQGVGIDLSSKMIDYAKKRHPNLCFYAHDAELPLPVPEGETFDVIIISDVIGFFEDIQQTLENLVPLCTPRTRLIISYYTKHWEFLVKIAELLGLKISQPTQNFLSTTEFSFHDRY